MEKIYRKDIDGLRGIAVLAVLINHFNDHALAGGYLGVDIFFAISGFVITQSLSNKSYTSMKELLADFYFKRVKRILPALLFMTIIASILTVVFQNLPSASLKTGISALVGLSNISLLRESYDYFATPAQFNTFTHTWSLAVEEQFYVIFPILLWSTKFFSETSHNTFKKIFTFFCIASLGIFIGLNIIDPSAGYYLTPSRFWEMGAGCLCFLACQQNDQRTNRLKNLAGNSWVQDFSLILIIILFVFGEPKKFVLSSILMIVATSFLLAGGKEKSRLYEKLTKNQPLLGTGLLSYSLYLWHWPILAIAKTTVGITAKTIPAIAMIIAIASIFSYLNIESPIRKFNSNNNTHFAKLFTIGIGIVSIFSSILSLQALKVVHKKFRLPELLGIQHVYTQLDCIGKEVTDSNPRNESLNYCFQERNSSRAKFYLLGDSHAQSLLPMVRNSFPQEEMDVIALPNGDDYINSFWQKENLEIHKIPKISKLLANSLQDDFVGISFHRGHLNDELNKDIHVSLNKEVTSNKKELVATKNFMDLIELLQQRKLKIILFRDVPLLISPSIPISSCMLNEKLFSTDLCEVSKKQDIHTRMRQDRLIDFLALKYSLPVFDPSQYMYKTNEDNSFSWRNSEGFQIMTDHSHMSAEYASLISENFTEFLNNIKLNSGINSSSNSPPYHSNTGDKYD